jgi:hypothetical protein
MSEPEIFTDGVDLLAEAPWMRDDLGYVLNPRHLPAVQLEWEITSCHQFSPHEDWYHGPLDNSVDDAKVEAEMEKA